MVEQDKSVQRACAHLNGLNWTKDIIFLFLKF